MVELILFFYVLILIFMKKKLFHQYPLGWKNCCQSPWHFFHIPQVINYILKKKSAPSLDPELRYFILKMVTYEFHTVRSSVVSLNAVLYMDPIINLTVQKWFITPIWECINEELTKIQLIFQNSVLWNKRFLLFFSKNVSNSMSFISFLLNFVQYLSFQYLVLYVFSSKFWTKENHWPNGAVIFYEFN